MCFCCGQSRDSWQYAPFLLAYVKRRATFVESFVRESPSSLSLKLGQNLWYLTFLQYPWAPTWWHDFGVCQTNLEYQHFFITLTDCTTKLLAYSRIPEYLRLERASGDHLLHNSLMLAELAFDFLMLGQTKIFLNLHMLNWPINWKICCKFLHTKLCVHK